jgi:signal transduction histidine kinase
MFSNRSSIASGLKLFVIVGLLLFPVVYLSQSLLSEARQKRNHSSNRDEALKAAGLMIPVVTAAVSGEVPKAEAVEALVNQLAAPELKLSMRPSALTKGTAENKMTVALQTLRPIETLAKVHFGHDDSGHEMICLALNDMPRFMLGLAALQDQTSRAGALPTSLLIKVGQAVEAGQAVIERIDLVKALAGDSVKLEGLRISMAGVVDALQTIDAQTANREIVAASLATAGGIWQKSHGELVRFFAEQDSGPMQNTLGKVGFALFMSLFGLAGAMLFFGKTLRALDETKESHVVADQARIEAEAMNAKLSDINDDVVRLNRELADKMTRLKHAQDELLKRGRLEQLGQLTATVAHELRNPLGAVRTSAFLLERKIKDKGLGVEPQLQRISNGILRCDSIITQLLDFSRTKQIDAASGDFDGWLEGVIEEEARKLPSAVELHCTLGLDGKPVRFDKGRMQRAVINLLMNASEALVGTGDDPAKFAARNPKITLSTSVEDGMACLRVSDNGPGISPELIGKVREPLFTTKSFGTGLGIPAVDQIATQHGGRLDIESLPGQGASFSILLPLGNLEAKAA